LLENEAMDDPMDDGMDDMDYDEYDHDCADEVGMLLGSLKAGNLEAVKHFCTFGILW
jgi:hypothetical protein